MRLDKPGLLDSFVTLGIVVLVEIIYSALGFLYSFTLAGL